MLIAKAIEVIHLARQKKLFYMEGMWTRFFPAIVKLKELIQEGILGDIKVQLVFQFLRVFGGYGRFWF